MTSSSLITNSYGENFPSNYLAPDFAKVVESLEFMFHFFMILWILQTVTYWLYCVIAGVIGDWYFSRRDENGNKIRGKEVDNMSPWPICASFYRTVWNFGSICFAAFIIAVITFIQWVLRYMASKMKKGAE